jgi:hypothetical protein
MARQALLNIERFSKCLMFTASYDPRTHDIQLAKEEVAMFDQLKQAQLVSYKLYTDGQFKDLQITPAGALALVQWRELLEKHSFVGILASNIERALWLLIGVTLAVGGELVQKLLI